MCVFMLVLRARRKKNTEDGLSVVTHSLHTQRRGKTQVYNVFFFIKICVVSFPFDSSFPFNSPAPVQYLVFVYSNSGEDLYATTRALRDRDQTDMCSVSSTVLYRTHNTCKHNKISIVVTVLRIPLYRCSAYTYIDTKPIHTSHSVASVCRQ